ncbi:MAG TPA: hypothetical protein VET48_06270, partial [Steroidobacteraceae bacterium]|nr:hypothetical protein [Steroidobacteraceae bacterium]
NFLKQPLATNAVVHATAYQYDGIGRVYRTRSLVGTVSQLPNGLTENTATAVVFDAASEATSTTIADGTSDSRTATRRYDALGRVIQELSGEGSKALAAGQDPTTVWSRYGISYQYDDAGRKVSVTSVAYNSVTGTSQTNTTYFYYDAVGRLRFTVGPDVGNGANAGRVTELRYNTLEQLTDRINYAQTMSLANLTGGLLTSAVQAQFAALTQTALDKHTTYTYALSGQVKSTTSAEGANAQYVYNSFGEIKTELTKVDSSRTRETDYAYDLRGTLQATTVLTETSPVTEFRTYDAFGRLQTVQDRNGNISKFEYDRLGRTVATVDALSGRTVTAYDAFSRVLTVTDALNNQTTYSFDDVNRVVAVTTPQLIRSSTSYTREGEVATVLANGNLTAYKYDANGELTTVTDLISIVETRAYDTSGRLVADTDARNTVTSFTYDGDGHALTRTVDSATGGLALTTYYAFDGQGRLFHINNLDGQNITKHWTLDRDGRVTQELTDPPGVHLATQYTYDAEGRTLTVTAGYGSSTPRTTNYVYDLLGRGTEEMVDPKTITTQNDNPNGFNYVTNYKYDNDGNLIHKIDANGNSTWYVYDANNRLTFTIDALGDVTETIYDAENRVVR